MVVKISTKNQKPRQMEDLFMIDDEVFQIPVVVPPNLALAYIRDLRDGDEGKATAKAFDALLGKRGLDRLANCDALEPDQLEAIMDVINKKMMDAQEKALGKQ